jgi:hypothetical protein
VDEEGAGRGSAAVGGCGQWLGGIRAIVEDYDFVDAEDGEGAGDGAGQGRFLLVGFGARGGRG